jgi:hypothetical protein
MMGSGARYNLNPRFSFAGGATFMHVSNCYMSEPRYVNYGINAWGTNIVLCCHPVHKNPAMGDPREKAASSTPKACGNIAQLITEE